MLYWTDLNSHQGPSSKFSLTRVQVMNSHSPCVPGGGTYLHLKADLSIIAFEILGYNIVGAQRAPQPSTGARKKGM